VINHVAQTIASWLGSWSSWFGHDASASAAKMSDEESRQMAGSVDKIPTTTAGVSTDTGPAPELAMKGEARTSADRDRAAFEAKTASLETQGRADSRAPMGEDHIEATTAPEELTAMSLVAGMPAAAPATAMPTLASAPSEEVGIVAQEQHGAEADAALAKASADVSVERGKHAEHEAQVRAESDAQLRELKTKADADQAAARDAAHAEVGAARAQWQTEIDKKGADARKQAGQKVAEGMAQVEVEETKANAEAKRHIEEGRQKADQEKQKGEKEAADAKEKAKHKSSGFWGWVSSKAKAAFDGVKKAVSSAIDACRRAVKAVIEGAKKLAMAAIELARKAINAAIKAIGAALLAISDVLLAAFPQLKARFQGAIRKAVDKATAAVNRLADGLKQAVQKALDRLGAALDQALQLLEKGINAIIDVANAVVQGAIKAAQAVVEMLGTWAKLIKDVVAGPGTWLGKLGAAIVDGIKNHLWSAFKTTVVEWFKSKVFELLGIGGIILELLLEGGLTKEHILEMAMDALLVAIPAALVAILVEKLVSMIVPAAGALMAIIEGLQAAWGTISRIIAAFAAFMAFLLAVKSGGAGPLFAAVLAGAAVVVLDFVANWLLKKLASAARKVGAKLKGLAEKFKSKRKAKKDAKAGKQHDEHEAKKHQEHDEKNKRNDHDEKKREDEKKQERLNKAVQELPPKITAVLAKRPGRLMFRGRLLLWRTQYRLTALNVNTHEERFDVEAVVNPRAKLAEGYSYPAKQLYRMLRELGEEFLNQHPEILERAAARAREEGIDPKASKSSRAVAPRTAEEHLAVASEQRSGSSTRQGGDRTHIDHGQVDGGGRVGSTSEHPRRDTVSAGDAVVRGMNPDGSASGYRDYETLRKDMAAKGVDGEMLGQAMRECLAGRPIPSFMQGAEKELGEMIGLWFVTEPARDPRNAMFSMMRVERMANDKLKLEDGVMKHPAEMDKHIQATRGLNANLDNTVHESHLSRPKLRERVKELRKRQLDDLKAWFQLQVAGGNLPVSNDLAGLKAFIKERLELYFRMRE
jgi:Skp family chaperone for outer membrane proteins